MTLRWADEPIGTPEADLFDRTPYAEQIAKLISSNHSFGTSIVYAVSGEWGLGKTSLITLAKTHLENLDEDWTSAHFTPWATGDPHSLIREFYATLECAINDPDSRSTFKKAADIMLRIASPLTGLIPNIYLAKMTDNAIEVLREQLQESEDGNWASEFRKASEALKQYGRPILVIIDDIDRLQPDELTVLMKVIRLLGRLPNVHYLLAYDELSLHKSLQSSGLVSTLSDARQFLEKIVQHTFPTPPLTSHQLTELYKQRLNQIAERFDLDISSDPFLINTVIKQILPQAFSTPRAIYRFLAHLRQRTIIIDPEDINFTDAVLITIIQCAYPTLYSKLPTFKRSLTSGVEQARQVIDTITLLAPSADQEDCKNVLAHQFAVDIGVHTDDLRSQSSATIRHPEHFDNYFTMIVPSYDLSLAALEKARKELVDDSVTILPTLLDFFWDPNRIKAGRAIDLVIRKWDFHDWWEIRPSIATAMYSVDKLKSNGIDDSEFADKALEWCARLLVNFFNRTKRQGDFDWFADNVSTSLEVAALSPATHVFSRMIVVLDDLPVESETINFEVDESDRGAVESVYPQLRRIREALVARHIGEFVKNLLEKDEADATVSMGAHLKFIFESDASSNFRDELQKLLKNGCATFEDIAIRFVGISAEPPFKICDLYLGELGQLFPDEGLSFENIVDCFSRMRECEGVDWTNRRRIMGLDEG